MPLQPPAYSVRYTRPSPGSRRSHGTSRRRPPRPSACCLLYKSQGRYEAAEPLYQRALAIREKVLGPDHPSVATSLDNLALLYKSQGRYETAEPLYKRALAVFEKALGPDHPDVATSLENYAALLRKTGREDEAAELEARAKAIRAKHAEENP